MLLAVHRQQAARASPLGRPFRPPDGEEPGVKPFRIGQYLLVVFGTKQKNDSLPAVFNGGNRPMKFVQPPKITEQVLGEFGEIDAADRRHVGRARSLVARWFVEWFGDTGHEESSSGRLAGFAWSQDDLSVECQQR
jgi:hypothetical protein